MRTGESVLEVGAVMELSLIALTHETMNDIRVSNPTAASVVTDNLLFTKLVLKGICNRTLY